MASIIESSEDAVIGLDLSGNVTSWNQAAEKLYGYAAEEIVWPARRSALARGSVGRGEEYPQQGAAWRPAPTFRTVRIRKDGRKLDVSLSISVIRDDSGQIVGCSKIARDIGDRKRAEQALLKADRRKDDFLALLGHELRNPLAGIVSGVEVLNELSPGDPEVA